MSLILEALRKSEAERQRGQAPGLFVEQQALRRRAPTRMPWALAFVAVALLIGLGWGWREWRRDPAPTPAPTVAAAPAASPTDSPAAAVVAPMPRPDVAAADPAFADAGVPVDRETLPVVEVDPAPVLPVPTPVPTPAAPEPAPVAAAPVATEVAAPPPAVPAVVEETLPRLAELPADERAALPPLRLSMHVYSEDPARRFVIVDEHRLTEGAVAAPGLVVLEIRRDGAVLSANGRRLLLPRP